MWVRIYLKNGRVAAKLLDLLLRKGHFAIIHIDESIKNAAHLQEKERGFRNYYSYNENPDLSGIFISTSKGYQIAKIIRETEHKKIAIIIELVS